MTRFGGGQVAFVIHQALDNAHTDTRVEWGDKEMRNRQTKMLRVSQNHCHVLLFIEINFVVRPENISIKEKNIKIRPMQKISRAKKLKIFSIF